MSEYVLKVNLEVNGQDISDFKSVTESEVELRKEIRLMNKTGFADAQPRYGAEVEYVVPSDAAEFDFEAVKNGTLTIDKNNGVRVAYTGVYCLKVGSVKYDGDNEAVRTITFGATGRN